MSGLFDTNSSDVLFTTTNLGSVVSRTICGWIKFILAGAGTIRTITNLYDAGPTHQVRLDWSNTDHLTLSQPTGASQPFPADPTITNWIFVAMTAGAAGAGSLNGYYRDNASGALASPPASTTGIASYAPGTFTLGQIGAAGCSAELENWIEADGVWTPTQILAQSLQRAPIAGITLRRWMKIADGPTAGVDSSGNGFDMTASGAITTGASSPIFPAAAALLTSANNGGF